MTIKKLYRTLLVYRIYVSTRYETNGITQKYSDFFVHTVDNKCWRWMNGWIDGWMGCIWEKSTFCHVFVKPTHNELLF